MWAMFTSEPVSKLSTQITRFPRRSSSSHRCDPRKPAPPVTRQAVMAAESSRARGWAGSGPAGPRDRALDPRPLLALPDRRPRLDLVDDLSCAVERLAAVRGRGRDRNRGLPPRHRADPVLGRRGAQPMALDRRLPDLTQLTLGH